MPQIETGNVQLIKGWFNESIPRFLNDWNGRAAIVHLDCDLYLSTRQCLSLLLPRCQTGTVILFDEYYNYRDFAAHEWLAWKELCTTSKLTAPCIAYDGRRAAFQLSDIEKPFL
jgi:Macrocin-O-methyltransferase (TylF)